MKDPNSLHLKLQEHIDCHATTDPLKEMSMIGNETDRDEAALKWLGLAVLHGIDRNAKKINISRSEDGETEVSVKYRKSDIPSPGPEIGEKIIQALRELVHIEGKKINKRMISMVEHPFIEASKMFFKNIFGKRRKEE